MFSSTCSYAEKYENFRLTTASHVTKGLLQLQMESIVQTKRSKQASECYAWVDEWMDATRKKQTNGWRNGIRMPVTT